MAEVETEFLKERLVSHFGAISQFVKSESLFDHDHFEKR